jgi:hypothetical protein
MTKPISIIPLLLLLISCNDEQAATGPDVWVAIEPKQCMDNAWERDWAEQHKTSSDNYPGISRASCIGQREFEVIRDFYSRDGAVVLDAETAPKYITVCAACDCPEGHVLFLLVRAQDAETMTTRRGFRLEAPSSSPQCLDGYQRVVTLLKETPVFAICALGDVLPGTDPIRVAALGNDWQTYDIVDLIKGARSDAIDPAVDQLVARIQSLPKKERVDVAFDIDQWLETYDRLVTIRQDGVEAFATGVAFVPGLAGALPADIAVRARTRESVGDNLASAEHVELMYALLRRLAQMGRGDRRHAMDELQRQAHKAND